jgi:hypothetical protein
MPDTTTTQIWMQVVTVVSTLIASLIGGAAVILGQHLSSSAERKARESDALAADERASKRFQAKTLIQIQECVIGLVSGTMKHIQTGYMTHLTRDDVSNELHKKRFRLAILGHRAKDDQLRQLIRELLAKIIIYLGQTEQSSSAEAAKLDLNRSLQTLIDRLGEILRTSI